MVVDDDYDVRAAIAEILEDEGHAAVTAANGADALALLRRGIRPKLILLDLMMPVMDGEEFCRVWNQDPALRPIPIVIISAAGDASEKTQLCRGAKRLLQKPIRLSTLLESVETFAT